MSAPLSELDWTGKLTPVSDTTVKSAFSESDPPDFDNTQLRRGPGRPKSVSSSSTSSSSSASNHSSARKSRAIETLLNDPGIVSMPLRRYQVSNALTSGISPSVVEFHRACQYGQLGLIEAMIRKRQVLVNCRDSGFNTPLHEAAVHNQLEAVKLLLKLGADINAENMLRERPVSLARQPEIIEILRDFEVCQGSALEDPFLTACWRGKKRKVRMMIQSGIDVNVSDCNGNTGLHYVAMWNNTELARILLDENARLDIKNSKGNNCLHEACRFSSPDLVGKLLEAGAIYSAPNNEGYLPIHFAGRSLFRIFRKFARDHSIEDPGLLSPASTKRYVEVSENEEDVDSLATPEATRPVTGLTREERKLQQMLAIFSRSVPPTDLDSKKKRGRPQASSAIVTDDEKFPSRKGRIITPPPTTVRASRSRLDPSYVDKSTGRTQLHKYSARGALDNVQELITLEKSLLRRKDNAGYLALHEACLHGHLPVVKFLVESGANINAQASNGDTPLHDAAENGHLNVVKFLLFKGANKNVKNQDQKRPVDVAIDDEITSVLMDVVNALAMPERPPRKARQKVMIESEGSESDGFRASSPHRLGREGSMVEDSMGGRVDGHYQAATQNFNGSIVTSTGRKGPETKFVEVISQEPLVQLHCGATEGDIAGWFFLGPQVEQLFHKTFGLQRLLDSIPDEKRRQLSFEDSERLLQSAIVEKLSSLKHYLSVDALSLFDKDSVLRAFDLAGGNLSNVPVMYVDLQRLSRRQSLPLNSQLIKVMKESERNIHNTGNNSSLLLLPPKLKMKWHLKTVSDNAAQ